MIHDLFAGADGWDVTLQAFPADHPWQGTKSRRYQQIGNAIPPGLAEAVLREVL